MCGRDLALMCRACDVDVCDDCLQLPKARARIGVLEADVIRAGAAIADLQDEVARLRTIVDLAHDVVDSSDGEQLSNRLVPAMRRLERAMVAANERETTSARNPDE